jgi:hypothetical protein
VAKQRPGRPFTSFANPFLTGAAERWPPEELVRYTFEALQALAREHDIGRRQDETPLEFVERAAKAFAPLRKEAHALAQFYAQAAYARGRLPASCVDRLRTFWDLLEAAAEGALAPRMELTAEPS